jgi:hypothetical protein
MEKFDEIVATTEKLLIAWARPEGWSESPLSTWPLTQFDLAVKIALGYLAFVFIGSVRLHISHSFAFLLTSVLFPSFIPDCHEILACYSRFISFEIPLQYCSSDVMFVHVH